MNGRYFTQVRNDVLDNPDISLEAKGLYSLIAYNLTASLRELLLDPTTRDRTIKASKELEKFDYAHFNGIEECIDKKSLLVYTYQFNLQMNLNKELIMNMQK